MRPAMVTSGLALLPSRCRNCQRVATFDLLQRHTVDSATVPVTQTPRFDKRAQSMAIIGCAIAINRASRRHASSLSHVRRAASDRPSQSSGSMSVEGVAQGKEPVRKLFFGDIFKAGKYAPCHTEMFDTSASEKWNTWLAPGFHDLKQAAATAIQSGTPTLELLPALCEKGLREEAPGVYSFELFTAEFCDMLLEEVEHAQRSNREDLDRPNGMNRYGIVLNQLGMEPMITALQQEHLLPLQAALYPTEGGTADDHHCFIVRYKVEEDVGLDMHEDDSDVTLNVCLGKDFTAATLSFCGLAADEDHRKLRHTYNHEKGRAVLHLGRQRHGADNIDAGERVNFILWSTSHHYRHSEAYMSHRLRMATALPPDQICLSYTHDKDYGLYLRIPTNAEAASRGVMLEAVERRSELYRRPVHDLARPLDEINTVPSVCLFLESLPPQQQHAMFAALMEVASNISGGVDPYVQGRPPQIMFFVAVQSGGAVPQVRRLCGLSGSPALALLDVAKDRCYRFGGSEIDPASITSFVEEFLGGRLTDGYSLGGQNEHV